MEVSFAPSFFFIIVLRSIGKFMASREKAFFFTQTALTRALPSRKSIGRDEENECCPFFSCLKRVQQQGGRAKKKCSGMLAGDKTQKQTWSESLEKYVDVSKRQKFFLNFREDNKSSYAKKLSKLGTWEDDSMEPILESNSGQTSEQKPGKSKQWNL